VEQAVGVAACSSTPSGWWSARWSRPGLTAPAPEAGPTVPRHSWWTRCGARRRCCCAQPPQWRIVSPGWHRRWRGWLRSWPRPKRTSWRCGCACTRASPWTWPSYPSTCGPWGSVTTGSIPCSPTSSAVIGCAARSVRPIVNSNSCGCTACGPVRWSPKRWRAPCPPPALRGSSTTSQARPTTPTPSPTPSCTQPTTDAATWRCPARWGRSCATPRRSSPSRWTQGTMMSPRKCCGPGRCSTCTGRRWRPRPRRSSPRWRSRRASCQGQGSIGTPMEACRWRSGSCTSCGPAITPPSCTGCCWRQSW